MAGEKGGAEVMSSGDKSVLTYIYAWGRQLLLLKLVSLLVAAVFPPHGAVGVAHARHMIDLAEIKTHLEERQGIEWFKAEGSGLSIKSYILRGSLDDSAWENYNRLGMADENMMLILEGDWLRHPLKINEFTLNAGMLEVAGLTEPVLEAGNFIQNDGEFDLVSRQRGATMRLMGDFTHAGGIPRINARKAGSVGLELRGGSLHLAGEKSNLQLIASRGGVAVDARAPTGHYQQDQGQVVIEAFDRGSVGLSSHQVTVYGGSFTVKAGNEARAVDIGSGLFALHGGTLRLDQARDAAAGYALYGDENSLAYFGSRSHIETVIDLAALESMVGSADFAGQVTGLMSFGHVTIAQDVELQFNFVSVASLNLSAPQQFIFLESRTAPIEGNFVTSISEGSTLLYDYALVKTQDGTAYAMELRPKGWADPSPPLPSPPLSSLQPEEPPLSNPEEPKEALQPVNASPLAMPPQEGMADDTMPLPNNSEMLPPSAEPVDPWPEPPIPPEEEITDDVPPLLEKSPENEEPPAQDKDKRPPPPAQVVDDPSPLPAPEGLPPSAEPVDPWPEPPIPPEEEPKQQDPSSLPPVNNPDAETDGDARPEDDPATSEDKLQEQEPGDASEQQENLEEKSSKELDSTQGPPPGILVPRLSHYLDNGRAGTHALIALERAAQQAPGSTADQIYDLLNVGTVSQLQRNVETLHPYQTTRLPRLIAAGHGRLAAANRYAMQQFFNQPQLPVLQEGETFSQGLKSKEGSSPHQSWSIWLRSVGGIDRAKVSQSGHAALENSYSGGFTGATKQLDHFALSVSAGYLRSSFEGRGDGYRADGDSFMMMATLGSDSINMFPHIPLQFDVGTAYGYTRLEQSRRDMMNGHNDSRFGANSFHVSGGVTHHWSVSDQLVVKPRLSMDYTYVSLENYREQGGLLPLGVRAGDYQSLRPNISSSIQWMPKKEMPGEIARGTTPIEKARNIISNLTLEAHASYGYEMMDRSTTLVSHYLEAPDFHFITTGEEERRHEGRFGVNIGTMAGRLFSFSGGYEATLSDDYEGHQLYLQANKKF